MIHNKVIRTAVRNVLFGLAALWLLVEALLVLEATFPVPCGLQCLVVYLARQPGIVGEFGTIMLKGWPTVFFTFLLLLWQEVRRWARKWLKSNRGRQRANLVITAWFVFLLTLKAVDLLSDVTLVLPESARETSIMLAYMLVASWCSRLTHWVQRWLKRIARIQRRFRTSFMDTLRLAIAVIRRRIRKLNRTWKGFGHVHAPRRTYRRAA